MGCICWEGDAAVAVCHIDILDMLNEKMTMTGSNVCITWEVKTERTPEKT